MDGGGKDRSIAGMEDRGMADAKDEWGQSNGTSPSL